MKKITFILLLLIAIMVSACNKNNSDPTPLVEEKNGSISGIINPANAILSIHATNGLTGSYEKFTAQPDPTTGQFILNNLPAGNYSLSFIAADNYFAPLPKDVIVVAKQNTSAETISPVKSVFHFNFANGSLWNGPATLIYINNSFNLVATQESYPFNNDFKVTTTFNISIPNFTGPGTYPCSKNTDAFIGFGGLNSSTTKQDSGNGVVIIDSIDTLTHIITGTFSGTLAVYVTNPGTGVKTLSTSPLTEGKFTMKY